MLLHACCANPHVLLLCRSIHTLATISTVFPFPLVFRFPHFPQRPITQEVCGFFFAGGGGGYLCHIVPRIAFSAFSNPPFSPTQPIIFLNWWLCVFLARACIRLFLVFPCPHFPFQPIFPNAPFPRGEVPVCLGGWGIALLSPFSSEVAGGSALL